MDETFNIEYLPQGTIETAKLVYVIIGAREGDNWIFVRNRERNSWELPAGHIEENENIDEAARRELFEETGTTHAILEPLFDYSVYSNGKIGYGRLYYAEVHVRGSLPDSEIGEICLSRKSPEPATYPEAHWSFLEILERHHLAKTRKRDNNAFN